MEKELQEYKTSEVTGGMIPKGLTELKAKRDFLSARINYLNLKRMAENYIPDTASYEREFDTIIDEENGGTIIMYGRRFFPSYILKKLDFYTYDIRLQDYATMKFREDKTTDIKFCELLQDLEEAENDLHECKMALAHFGYTFD